MAISKSLTTVNLKVHRITDLPHMAIKFFTVLIENNKDKLRVCEESPKIPGDAEDLARSADQRFPRLRKVELALVMPPDLEGEQDVMEEHQRREIDLVQDLVQLE